MTSEVTIINDLNKSCFAANIRPSLVHDVNSAIFRTVVQQMTRFQLTYSASRVPSAIAEFLVSTVKGKGKGWILI